LAAGTSKASARLRVVAVFLAAAILVLLAFLFLRADKTATEAGIAAPSQAALHQAAPRAVKLAAPAPAPSINSRRPSEPIAPIIDEIIVEKPEVCEGEENLITVKAHTVDGTDPYLHAAIGGGRGMSVPLKTYLRDGQPMRNVISVFGKNNIATVVDVPPYVVKPCKPERVVNVLYRGLSNRIDEFEFFAKVSESDKGNKPFNPRRYLWDFGDGKTEETISAFTSHAYRHDEPQKGLYTMRLVKVEVFGEGEDSVIGRTSLQLFNEAYEHLKKFDVIALMSQGTPRFPTLDKDGWVRQKFEVWHYYDQPVEIQKLVVIRQDTSGRRTAETEADLATTLNETEIPVAKSIDVELTLDTKRHSDVVALVYRLEGTSADGKRAVGEISVMVPPPKPTAQNSQPVGDPRMVAKIQKAVQILRQDTVSQEEIWRLEREGKLR